jgi:GDP-L-fucose synthase
MADACLFLLEQAEVKLASLFNNEHPPLVNIGCGEDLTIRELAELIAKVVGFQGSLAFDTSKPDGTMRKVMDVSRINKLGWQRRMQLRDGIVLSYQDMLIKI